MIPGDWCLPRGYWGNSDADIIARLLLLFITKQNLFKHPLLEWPPVCLALLSLAAVVPSSGYLGEVAKVAGPACASRGRATGPSVLGVAGILLTELGPKHLSSHGVGNVPLVHSS